MTEHAGTQHIHGYCALRIARCGTVATVEDGRFTRLDPDPTHPTGQAICAKGRAAPEGSVRAHARLNATLDPRVVVGEHG